MAQEEIRVTRLNRRHCEERSDEAIHSFFALQDGLLRFARNDGAGTVVVLHKPYAALACALLQNSARRSASRKVAGLASGEVATVIEAP